MGEESVFSVFLCPGSARVFLFFGGDYLEEKFMKMALALAHSGIGAVNPNPLVGAVIVKDGQIIATGYHKKYGAPHAEIEAFNAAKASGEDVAGAEMYVTLEPCSHFGKTPPCASAIVEKGIKRVYIAMKDPNPLVSGAGIRIHEEAGIEVVTGILEKEAMKLNEIFIKYITTSKPFVLFKSAMTLDGKIASHTGDSRWITSEPARAFVHEIRNEYSAIMVGIGTVLNDNPSLDTRLDRKDTRNPVRIIVDSMARLPLDAKVLKKDGTKVIVAVGENAPKDKIDMLEQAGAKVIVSGNERGGVNLEMLMERLGSLKIDSILLEGGGTLAASMLENGLVDKVSSFIAPKIIGGAHSKTPVEGKGIEKMADAIELIDVSYRQIGPDIIVEGYLRK